MHRQKQFALYIHVSECHFLLREKGESHGFMKNIVHLTLLDSAFYKVINIYPLGLSNRT